MSRVMYSAALKTKYGVTNKNIIDGSASFICNIWSTQNNKINPSITFTNLTNIIAASNKNNVTFQQVAFGFEAISESWGFNAYSLLHVGEYEKRLNSAYQGGALNTYGLDISRNLTSKIKASAGIYHQENNLEHIDGTGYRASLDYDVGNGYEVNWTLSDDKGYDTRGVLSLKFLFGSKPKTSNIAKAFD